MSEILINQLFAGSYLQEGTNIGHEIINIFRDDNDENYLFITPYGNVNGHDVDKVLFVQNIKARETMEIVITKIYIMVKKTWLKQKLWPHIVRKQLDFLKREQE